MKFRLKQVAQDGATDGQVATFDAATGLWKAKTSSGGGGFTLYTYSNATSTNSGTLPVTDAPIAGMSITLPPSSVARMALTSFALVTDSHSNRPTVYLDSGAFVPSNSLGAWSNDQNRYSYTLADIPVPIPGDGSSHTVAIYWVAQGSVGAVNMIYRSLVLKVV